MFKPNLSRTSAGQIFMLQELSFISIEKGLKAFGQTLIRVSNSSMHLSVLTTPLELISLSLHFWLPNPVLGFEPGQLQWKLKLWNPSKQPGQLHHQRNEWRGWYQHYLGQHGDLGFSNYTKYLIAPSSTLGLSSKVVLNPALDLFIYYCSQKTLGDLDAGCSGEDPRALVTSVKIPTVGVRLIKCFFWNSVLDWLVIQTHYKRSTVRTLSLPI